MKKFQPQLESILPRFEFKLVFASFSEFKFCDFNNIHFLLWINQVILGIILVVFSVASRDNILEFTIQNLKSNSHK